MKPQLKDFVLYLFFLIAAVLLVIFLFSSNDSSGNKTAVSGNKSAESTGMNNKQYSSLPEMKISPEKKYSAILQTSLGDINIGLFAKETPVTVNNFVFLAREGFYDGTIFHRVIKDFMIQGGDPNGNGSGGPGYVFDDEKITRDYKRGIVAMANRGPNTNGSQFFIMHKDYNLPKRYVIFGQVTEGMDTVDKIAQTETVDNGSGEKSKPVETVTIESVTIEEK